MNLVYREIYEVTSRRHLCLTGMAGVGKSWVGEELAKLLQFPWWDTDLEVEKIAGKSIDEIFSEDGEPRFRTLEAEVTKAVLLRPSPSVISLGGGTILNAPNRAVLKKYSIVVFLRASHSTLYDYLVTASSRPLLSGNLSERLEAMLRDRSELYVSSSDFVVDVDGKELADICQEIVSLAKL